MRERALLSSLALLLLFAAAGACFGQAQGAKEIPREWIDPDTGHRVVRLSDEAGSQSLYFHQNAYTPDGEKLIITTPTGLSMVNLKTRAIDPVSPITSKIASSTRLTSRRTPRKKSRNFLNTAPSPTSTPMKRCSSARSPKAK